MEFDLTRNLRDLSAAPEVPADAVHLAAVRTRVRHGRTIRTAAVALGSAAAALAIGAVVYASPWQTPAPAETPTPPPTVDPTPEPTPEPTPSQTPTPDALPPIVALTSQGALVPIDPATGEIGEPYVSGLPLWRDGSVTIDRVHQVAYVGLSHDDGPGTIVRVSLEAGTWEHLAQGEDPALSPDGTVLAYVADSPTEDYTMGVALLDLGSGDVRHVPDADWCECDRSIDQPAWSPDGTRLFTVVQTSTDIAPSPTWISSIDPDAAESLQDGTALAPPELEERWHGWQHPTPLPSGRLVVFGYQGEYVDIPARVAGSSHLAFLDPGTGAELDRVDLPDVGVGDLVVSPDGSGLALVAPTGDIVTEAGAPLYLWDPESGLREVTQGIAAVAW